MVETGGSILEESKRSGQDPNPRWPFDHSGFRDQLAPPLLLPDNSKNPLLFEPQIK
jgi:hypothetical protein